MNHHRIMSQVAASLIPLFYVFRSFFTSFTKHVSLTLDIQRLFLGSSTEQNSSSSFSLQSCHFSSLLQTFSTSPPYGVFEYFVSSIFFMVRSHLHVSASSQSLNILCIQILASALYKPFNVFLNMRKSHRTHC